MSDWTLQLRDPAGLVVDEIVDHHGFGLTRRFNAVGAWAATLPAGSPYARWLATPGWGLVVLGPSGATALSGPMRTFEREANDVDDRIVFGGYDDMVWLARRLASPQPASSGPPYNMSAYDVRTGAAGSIIRQYVDVNAGPGAIAARRVQGMTLATDAGLGSILTGRARWQRLIDLVAELAAFDGLGVRLVGLQLQIYQPVDRSDTIRFGTDRANLDAFRYSLTAPEANHVFVAGGGEGAARVIVEQSDTAGGWGRIEAFRDRRDTTNTGELTSTGITELAAGAASASVTSTPSSTAPDFGSYDVGDRVAVEIDGTEIVDVVRELVVTVTTGDEGGVTVRPTVGSIDSRDPNLVNPIRRAVDRIGRDLRDLQRR